MKRSIFPLRRYAVCSIYSPCGELSRCTVLSVVYLSSVAARDGEVVL